MRRSVKYSLPKSFNRALLNIKNSSNSLILSLSNTKTNPTVINLLIRFINRLLLTVLILFLLLLLFKLLLIRVIIL